jgi:hypothetical protein
MPAVGAASGLCNVPPLTSGTILQPAVDWMLTRNWRGAVEDGARVHDAATYRSGFARMVGAVALAAIILLFARKNCCRQMRR